MVQEKQRLVAPSLVPSPPPQWPRGRKDVKVAVMTAVVTLSM